MFVLFIYKLETLLEIYLDFFSEITLVFLLLAELLFLAVSLKYAVTFENKRKVAIESCSKLALCLLLIAMGLIFIYMYRLHIDMVLATEYFRPTTYTVIIQSIALAISSFILWNSVPFIKTNQKNHLMEYPFLFVFSLWFLLLLIVSNNLLVTFISLVGFSLCLYVITMMFSVGKLINKGCWGNNHLGHAAHIKHSYLRIFSSTLITCSKNITIRMVIVVVCLLPVLNLYLFVYIASNVEVIKFFNNLVNFVFAPTEDNYSLCGFWYQYNKLCGDIGWWANKWLGNLPTAAVEPIEVTEHTPVDLNTQDPSEPIDYSDTGPDEHTLYVTVSLLYIGFGVVVAGYVIVQFGIPLLPVLWL